MVLWTPVGSRFPLEFEEIKDQPMVKAMFAGRQGSKVPTTATVTAELLMSQALPYNLYAYWVVGYFGREALALFNFGKHRVVDN